MNLKDITEKAASLEDLKIEIIARNTAISVMVNVINAYLQVHSLSQVEIEAIQKALDNENNQAISLMTVLGNALSITEPPAAPTETEAPADGTDTPAVEAVTETTTETTEEA